MKLFEVICTKTMNYDIKDLMSLVCMVGMNFPQNKYRDITGNFSLTFSALVVPLSVIGLNKHPSTLNHHCTHL